MTKPTMSVQVYSVRELFVEGKELNTLKEIAAIGYEGIEFTEAIMQYPVDTVKSWLAEAGLVCTGMAAGWPALQEGTFEDTLKYLKALGTNNLLIGYATFEETRYRDKLAKIIDRINYIYEVASKEGFYVAYHAHYPDFYFVDGVTVWDRILQGTPKEFGMCVDTGNMISVGVDPVAYLNKYPGKGKVCHLKPFNFRENCPATLVDDDGNDWNLIVDTCLDVGKAEYLVVEYGSYRCYSALEAIKLCYERICAHVANR